MGKGGNERNYCKITINKSIIAGKNMAKYAILSDIHGNLPALQAVCSDIEKQNIDAALLLGDIIDYGMQSNECVHYISRQFPCQIKCNLWGNHERAIMQSDFTGFSSKRGAESAMHTAKKLNQDVKEYLDKELTHEGYQELELDGLKALAVHGSLENPYWKSIFPENVNGDYSSYDVALSGHSHNSHMFTKFYRKEDEKMRNQHTVIFLNPGSVGQPRNHRPQAQYAVFDTDTKAVEMRALNYDIKLAMSYFDGSVDDFYRTRLLTGI